MTGSLQSGRGFGPSLAHSERGAGPDVLLLHGHTGSRRNWAFVVRGLNAAGFRTTTYDHIGHGGSPAPDDLDLYSIEGLASDCLDFADARGLERPLLVGHSLGGMVAQAAALEAPDRFAGLALVCTSGRPIPEPVASQFRKAMEIVDARGIEFLFDLQMRPDRIDPATAARIEASPGLESIMRREFMRNTPQGYIGCGQALIGRRPLLDELEALELETSVIVGESDLLFRPESEELARRIPGATYEVIAGAAHSPNVEAPGRLVEAIKDLAKRTRVSR